MRTRYLIAVGAATVLTAAAGTGIALASTLTSGPVPDAVPVAVPASAHAVDNPEPGDTPDAPGQG